MNLISESGADGLILRVNEDRIDAAVAIHFKDRLRELTAGGEGPVRCLCGEPQPRLLVRPVGRQHTGAGHERGAARLQPGRPEGHVPDRPDSLPVTGSPTARRHGAARRHWAAGDRENRRRQSPCVRLPWRAKQTGTR